MSAKIVMLIQARMGATRFPGKPLKEIMGRPMLSYQLERLRRVKRVDEIVLATTTHPRDDCLVAFCEKEKIPYFRGSEDDVLDRFLQAAREHRAQILVRITGDCPLSDPNLIDQVIEFFLKGGYDYVTNSPNCNFPRGVDVEVFSMSSFEKLNGLAKLTEEHEHVTPYYYRHPEIFKLGKWIHPVDLSHYRWTVDTPEDFQLVTTVFENLYPKNPHFGIDDIVQAFQKHPEWEKINAHIKQKALGNS